jgi:hypothetical protein
MTTTGGSRVLQLAVQTREMYGQQGFEDPRQHDAADETNRDSKRR